jgi:hypothetical protein
MIHYSFNFSPADPFSDTIKPSGLFSITLTFNETQDTKESVPVLLKWVLPTITRECPVVLHPGHDATKFQSSGDSYVRVEGVIRRFLG